MKLAALQLKSIAIALLLSSCATQAPIAEDSLPAPVREARETFAKDCAPDTPVFDRDLILKADLNGDGRDDYVVNGFAYECRNYASFCGSAGCEVQIFLSTPAGALEQSFDGWLEERPRIVGRSGAAVIAAGAGRRVLVFDARSSDFMAPPR